MTRKVWLPAIFLAVLLLSTVACGHAPATTERFTKNPDGYVDITVEQLAEMLPGKGFVIICFGTFCKSNYAAGRGTGFGRCT